MPATHGCITSLHTSSIIDKRADLPQLKFETTLVPIFSGRVKSNKETSIVCKAFKQLQRITTQFIMCPFAQICGKSKLEKYKGTEVVHTVSTVMYKANPSAPFLIRVMAENAMSEMCDPSQSCQFNRPF